MHTFTFSAIAIATALALAACAPAPAPVVTVTAQQVVTALSKGRVTEPGDKVTVTWSRGLLAGRQLVLLQGSANGAPCWQVDPSTTLPPAGRRRVTTLKNCNTKDAAGATH